MTTTYGVTPAGFLRPDLPEIKAELQAAIEDEFGPTNFDQTAVQVVAGVWAAMFNRIFEGIEAIYEARFWALAHGVQLDHAVELVGLFRNGASATTVPAALIGVEGTRISPGRRASLDGTGEQFYPIAETLITRASAIVGDFEVTNAEDATLYQVSISGTIVGFTSGVGATTGSIATGLVAAIDALAPVTATANGAVITVRAEDGRTPFSFAPISNTIEVRRVGSPAFMIAVETGAIEVPVGALTSIDTPVAGWDAVENLIAGATGRDTEKDDKLRTRVPQTVRGIGAATQEAIQARVLQEVASVRTCRVYINKGSSPDADGRNPKSYEAVVNGGDVQEIADKLWQVGGAGIEYSGNTERIVIDSNGDPQVVRFSVPAEIFIWIKVEIAEVYDEEELPADPVKAVKDAVAATVLLIGRDVIAQRIARDLQIALPGVSRFDVTIAAGEEAIAPEPGDYGAADIPIAVREIAKFSADRVTVNVP